MKQFLFRGFLLFTIVTTILIIAVGAASSDKIIDALISKDRTLQFNGATQYIYDEAGEQVYPITYNGTTYIPIESISKILGIDISLDPIAQTISVSEDNNHLDDEEFWKLAEEYVFNQIPEVKQQQSHWYHHLNSDSTSEPSVDIISARVEIFDYVLTYREYRVFKYNGSFLPSDPKLIFCVDEWTMREDGWYTDMRPQYMIFSDDGTSDLLGVMMCEFSPIGNPEVFFTDLDQWIMDFETAESE